MVDKLFVATKAFITNNSGEVLLLKESTEYDEGTNAGKWDVAGGRINPGQSFDESLKREIKEESGLEAEIEDPFYTDEWRPKVKDEKWQIVGTYFKCSTDSTEVALGEDHEEFAWVDPDNYSDYDLIRGLKTAFEKFLERRKQTKAAGKAVVISDQGKILLMKRAANETHLQNFWDVPGGSLNHGELPEEALKREVMEEASIEIEVVKPVNTWTYMHDNCVHRFGATYLCIPESQDIKLSGEHTEFRWVTVKELDDLAMYDELREGVKLAYSNWKEKN